MSSKAATSKVVERSTRQRAAILAAMEGIDEFKSAQEIYVLLTNKKVDVGMANVYRTLQKKAEREEVDAILNEDGETHYRNCGQSEGHHHHLICRKCGLTITIEGPAIETWTHKTAQANGFREVGHRVEIFGICKNC